MISYLKSGFVIFLMVSFTTIQAQIKSGYVAGMNLSTLTLKKNNTVSNPDFQGGVHVGWFFDIPITDKIIFNPSLLFSAKGADYTIDSVRHSLAPVYIEIPANFAYRFDLRSVKVFLFAGPYLACGMGGLAMNSEGILQDISFGSGENSDLRPFDYGFNFGAGMNHKGLTISVQYGIGLANISPPYNFFSEMKNKVIGVSISRYSKTY